MFALNMTLISFASHNLWHVFLLLPAYLIVLALYNYLLHPLRKVPGPFAAKITELWRTRRYFLGKWHDDILELHQKYGPVVRISPNEVSFVDRDALLKVYGHSTGTLKTNWYDVWKLPGSNNGSSFFAVQNPKQHSFLRKRVAHAYSMSTILSLEPLLQDIANSVWEQFDIMAKEHRIVDLQEWANFFAFDVVCQLGLGGPLGCVRSGSDVNHLIKIIHEIFFLSSNIGYLPGQTSLVNNAFTTGLLRLLGKPNQAGSFRNWLLSLVEKRVTGPEDESRSRDMLDLFISMKGSDGQPANRGDILGEMGNLLGAGADTTAVGIAVVLGQLLIHPDSYHRLQREVDDAYAGLKSDGKTHLDFRTAEGIPYLSACIKEATRLCPSILWQLPRHAPAEGIEIAGHYVPGGATLSMSPIAQNRCKEIWGEDADDWSPERFIVGEKGTTREYLREIEKMNVTFGFGSRTCIGKNLALVEMYKFVGQFVHRYDCELVDKSRPFTRRSQWFCLQDDLKVYLKRRV